MPILHAGFRILVGLLPVFAFLLALILLDSFKLVKLRTVAGLFGHFTHRQRFFMVPLLVILLLAALFLLFTGGLSLVAPLVYPLI